MDCNGFSPLPYMANDKETQPHPASPRMTVDQVDMGADNDNDHGMPLTGGIHVGLY